MRYKNVCRTSIAIRGGDVVFKVTFNIKRRILRFGCGGRKWTAMIAKTVRTTARTTLGNARYMIGVIFNLAPFMIGIDAIWVSVGWAQGKSATVSASLKVLAVWTSVA